jgi:hypothetical protein
MENAVLTDIKVWYSYYAGLACCRLCGSILELVHQIILEWSSAHTSDRLYLEMCGTDKKAVICEGTNKEEKINCYYAEAATYARRISAGNFID